MISDGQNQCLRSVAALAAANADWKDYAQYCRGREAGLRYQAFLRLEKFLHVAKSWPLKNRAEFANWLCLRIVEFGESNSCGLIPQPLVVQLIVPTLQEWSERDTWDCIPCRWLGMFFSGVVTSALRAGLSEGTVDAYSHLREALSRNPRDELARIRLIEMIIGDVEYSCHHLPEGYIGQPETDLAKIAEAYQLLSGVLDEDLDTWLRTRLDYVALLIDDWIRFQKSGMSDFNQWCKLQGRAYQWNLTYDNTAKDAMASHEDDCTN